jgi:hypothetical protein
MTLIRIPAPFALSLSKGNACFFGIDEGRGFDKLSLNGGRA